MNLLREAVRLELSSQGMTGASGLTVHTARLVSTSPRLLKCRAFRHFAFNAIPQRCVTAFGLRVLRYISYFPRRIMDKATGAALPRMHAHTRTGAQRPFPFGILVGANI